MGNPTNLNQRLEARFTHDGRGNILTETDARGAVTTHTYDSSRGLFRVSTTNSVGHISSTTWSTACQLPTRQTDANGLVTQISYDALCRETGRSLPGGGGSQTSYANFGNPATQYAETRTRSSSPVNGRNWTVERSYVDGLGQVWKAASSGTTSAEGSLVVELRGYDARGNLAWTSLPRTWAAGNAVPAADQRTSFEYDALDRPLRTLFADGTEVRTSYEKGTDPRWGATTTVPQVMVRDAHCFDAVAANTLCGEVQTTMDAAGRTIASERQDSGLTDVGASGTLRRETFSYDLLGRLTAVTDPEGAVWAYTYDVYGNRLTADDPGLGRWTMTYDPNGNLSQQTDAKGQVIAFEYDALNRATRKAVGTGTGQVETLYTYDEVRTGSHNKGQLTTERVRLGGTNIHRVLSDWHETGSRERETHEVGGRSYALEYTYGLAGHLLDQRLPTTPGSTAATWLGPFSYDAANRITSWTGRITSVAYDLRGNPTEAVFANGARETGEYDPRRGWPTRLRVYEPAWATPLLETTYTRSATGRIARMDMEAPEGDLDFAYDHAGRLISAVNFSGLSDFTQSFTYDAAGRMRWNSRVGLYGYAPGGSFHAPDSIELAAGGVAALTYDPNGNMIAGLDGKVMEYDAENRPLGVRRGSSKTCYVYGAGGARLMKIEDVPPAVACPTPTTVPPGATVYLGPVEVRGFGTPSEQVIAYPNPSVRLVNGVASYLHRDGLSSVRAVTGTDGAADERAVYRPFGEQQEWVLDAAAAGEDKGFIGERYDADAGLQYLNARYYDPKLGLFLQPDWFEVTEPGVGTNRYSYSFNDPVNLSDPGGNGVVRDLVERVVKELFGGGVDRAGREAGEAAAGSAFKQLRDHARDRAWAQERELVRRGGGTYPWSDEQVKELLEFGRVSGMKAHHINSAAAYPEKAGLANNIRFVTQAEHDAIHLPGGGYHVPTQGPLIDRNAIYRDLTGQDLPSGTRETMTYDDVLGRTASAIDRAMNSRTMMVLDLFDPSFWADYHYQQTYGHSFFASPEEICAADPHCL